MVCKLLLGEDVGWGEMGWTRADRVVDGGRFFGFRRVLALNTVTEAGVKDTYCKGMAWY